MNSSKSFWLASVAAISLVAATGAQAGGFINQSQSTVFNGMGYAGYAAPGTSPSAMFLNPATMTEFRRFTTENNFSGVFPVTKITGSSVLGTKGSGDIGQDALVPSSYFVMPLNESLTAGLSINSPYGLTTKPDVDWAGQANSMTTKARTYAFTPSIAYRLSDAFSIGLGIQAQYFKATFLADANPAAGWTAIGLKGDSWGYGITAGITWKPMPGTAIGIGYRSRVDHKIDGEYVAPNALNGQSFEGTLRLPDRLNLSLRQSLTPEIDVLGSVEWHNWSRIGTVQLSGAAVALAPTGLQTIRFEYKDAWFFALGTEYKWSKDLTLRGGIAYELSPVTTEVRTTRLPDNNRLWLSTGASYKLTERFTMNASYSRVFVKDAPINIAAAAPTPAYTGQSKAHVDILSLGLMTRW